MQRLNEASEAMEPGLLVRLQASTGKVIDQIELLYRNPAQGLLHNGKLYVASLRYNAPYDPANEVDLANSGIEVVDLATGTTESVASGAELGGGASSLALDAKNSILYASVYAMWGSVPVKPIALAGNTVGEALPKVVDAFNGLAFDAQSGTLYIADSDYAGAAVKAWDGTTLSTVKDNAAIPLSPYSLLMVNF
jgi:DNA-binding beta-propeller fold protein YncE